MKKRKKYGKQRKTKIILIVILMFVIVGMNIGFAVFSNVLIINSSATVSPNESDFRVIVYGFVDQDEMNSFMLEGSSYVPDIEK